MYYMMKNTQNMKNETLTFIFACQPTSVQHSLNIVFKVFNKVMSCVTARDEQVFRTILLTQCSADSGC